MSCVVLPQSADISTALQEIASFNHQTHRLLWLSKIFVSKKGQRGKRIRFLAHSNLFLIVDWETLYGCGKFLSDSNPLEFETVD